jgi:hypothetical protein
MSIGHFDDGKFEQRSVGRYGKLVTSLRRSNVNKRLWFTILTGATGTCTRTKCLAMLVSEVLDGTAALISAPSQSGE